MVVIGCGTDRLDTGVESNPGIVEEGTLGLVQLSFLGKEYKCCNGCRAISS